MFLHLRFYFSFFFFGGGGSFYNLKVFGFASGGLFSFLSYRAWGALIWFNVFAGLGFRLLWGFRWFSDVA